MRFTVDPADANHLQAAQFDESLISRAANTGPVASVWQAARGLVVPRTYQHHQNFPAACDEFAQAGWPVTVRQSGGGIVPQGPGVLNLSLAYAVHGRPLDHSDSAYERICTLIQRALEEYAIEARMQAVKGSFCDGRYNLAVGPANDAKKVAGTAQVWRRVKTGPPDAGETGLNKTAESNQNKDRQVVLVHALILAHVDVAALTRQANLFEIAINSDRRYDPERSLSLHHCLGTPPAIGNNFTESLKQSLLRQLDFPALVR